LSDYLAIGKGDKALCTFQAFSIQHKNQIFLPLLKILVLAKKSHLGTQNNRSIRFCVPFLELFYIHPKHLVTKP